MDNLEEEIWKDIPKFNGLYQASNLGRIKSLERIDALGRRVKEKILKPWITHKGYYQAHLCKNSKVRHYMVHRLVYEAFNRQIPEGYEVNHINEIKSDNRLSNLNLMMHKENINWGTGIERRAKKLSKAVLQFDLNDNLVKEYPSAMQVERETGFSNGNIINCCKGNFKQVYGYKWKYKE